ncbi:lipocalin family protein [Desertivirga xinjiangensis]|uniref:lipocalin family protein n=1 Tax=Desertivirga xinjiangensis TaxID=539206 RepID=UPI00210CAA2B|nr:lipocalin family protein [Pedobacter xinjiangensis]
MKKQNFLFLMFVAVTVAFSSCKKDDDENNSAKIVGKWNLKKEVEKEYKNGQLIETDEYSYEAGAYVEFKSNGTVDWNDDGSDPEIYSYRVDGNKLTLIEDDDTDVYTIEELTSSKLVISESDEYTEGNDKIKEVYQYVMEK